MGLVAVGVRGRNGGIAHAVLAQVRDQLVLFAVEQELSVDRPVVRFLDLAEGVVQHALIGVARILQQKVKVERRDPGFTEERLIGNGALLPEIKSAGERCDGDQKGCGENAERTVQGLLVFWDSGNSPFGSRRALLMLSGL